MKALPLKQSVILCSPATEEKELTSSPKPLPLLMTTTGEEMANLCLLFKMSLLADFHLSQCHHANCFHSPQAMGSKAPSWADQWGSGSFGDEEDDNKLVTKKSSSGGSSKKMAEAKAAASAGFDKAKAAASVGAQKVKSGTSVGLKWVKKQYQKKSSSST
ncbi:hypothetical protein QYF36_011775 [Acer negundo]|nr:hypothetical protein QYF36_011775 [Acer negundo]